MDIPPPFAATYYSKVRGKYYRNWDNSDQLFSKAVRKEGMMKPIASVIVCIVVLKLADTILFDGRYFEVITAVISQISNAF
jgi:hypothetical protein